ncbi:MAG: RNA polymerase factor sigma-54 [Paracoccaceae bacterium]
MKPAQRIEIRQKRTLAMTASLRQAIAMLAVPLPDLRRMLEEAAQDNPYLELAPAKAVKAEERPRAEPPAGGRRFATGLAPAVASLWPDAHGGGGAYDPAEALAAPETGLTGHAMASVDLHFRAADEHALAVAMVLALEPTGWLGRPLEDIAAECGASLQSAETVLHEAQKQAEPAGLFARSLQECLRLQAVDRGEMDAAMTAVLDNLETVARGQSEALAAARGLRPEEIAGALDRLRRYDPKPGARFGQDAVSAAPADLVARRGRTGWEVAANGPMLPELRVTGAPEGKAAEAALFQARSLARGLERRAGAMLAVGQALVSRQRAFLDRGPLALGPLTLAELAGDTGYHISTVSRVVAGGAIQTPRGTLPMRAFLSGAVPTAKGAPVSSETVRQLIRRLVAGEDRARPLSDVAIGEALARDGMVLARRTVAKYRAELGIPAVSRRRR